MKAALIIMSVLSILFVASTLICGLWIHSQGSQIADLASSLKFHRMMAIGSMVFSFLTVVLAIVRK